MKAILKSVHCMTLLFFLLTTVAFAESEYVDDWLGIWTVTQTDQSVITWELTDTWVSDTGMSHLAYGVTSPGNVEFIVLYNGMFSSYYYIERPAGTTVYDLPQDFSQLSELVPSDDFQTFTAKEGAYPIESGYKGTVAPVTEPELCVASYLLGDDDPRLEILRQFRDKNLALSTTGKALITMYYEKSDAVIGICEKSPAANRSLKLILESLLPVINVLCNEE